MEEYIDLIAWFISALICGAISKSISNKRGLSGGFGWGFFLLVIGIIIVALLPVDEKRKEEYLDNTRHIYFCPQCFSTYSGTSNANNGTCPNCKSALSETTILLDTWQTFSDEKKGQMKQAFAEGQYLRYPTTNTVINSATNQVVGGAEEIKKYKELLDEGIITQEEFEAKKKQLLGL